MPSLLIDGDIICYRCGFAVEKTKYAVTRSGAAWEMVEGHKEAVKHAEHVKGLVWSRKEVEPESHALALVNTVLKDITERYPGHSPVVWLSGVGNFRDGIARRAKYKGNRDAAQRPVHFGTIRDHLCSRWNAVYTDGQEADDAIGIGMFSEPGSVSVSIDKDLRQLPGLHYDWTTKQEHSVSVRQANAFFYQQVLTGDATDNVPGIKGVGPVKAKAILEGVKGSKDAWGRCLKAYTEAYGKDDGYFFAVETAQLVYIRRKPDEIWQPPRV